MQITRDKIYPILKSISILEQNENFSITTKYNVLKIKEILQKEFRYNSILLKELVNKYGEIKPNGDIQVKKEYLGAADSELKEFNSQKITLPDLYFSLSEFEDKDISWSDLEALFPFIKQ